MHILQVEAVYVACKEASTIPHNSRRLISISSLFLGAKIVEYTDFRLHFLTFLPYFMIVSLFVSFLIFVKFDVEDFPLADADAGVTALVSLVAVMAT